MTEFQTAENLVGCQVEIQAGQYAGDTGMATRQGQDELHVFVELDQHGIEEEFHLKDIGSLEN